MKKPEDRCEALMIWDMDTFWCQLEDGHEGDHLEQDYHAPYEIKMYWKESWLRGSHLQEQEAK